MKDVVVHWLEGFVYGTEDREVEPWLGYTDAWKILSVDPAIDGYRFFKSRRDKEAKVEGWAPPFI